MTADHSDNRTACQLYPVIHLSGEAALIDKLQAIVAHARFESCLISPAPGQSLDAATARPEVELLQDAGIAAMIADDASLARTLRADGVHLTWRKSIVEAYGEAREIVGTRAMVGVDVGRSRHDAMTLGEAGADYIGFGIPQTVDDRDTASSRRLELIAWWSEIFEIPCVAFNVDNPHDAGELARAGADFIATTVPIGLSGADTLMTLEAFASALAMQDAET